MVSIFDDLTESNGLAPVTITRVFCVGVRGLRQNLSHETLDCSSLAKGSTGYSLAGRRMIRHCQNSRLSGLGFRGLVNVVAQFEYRATECRL